MTYEPSNNFNEQYQHIQAEQKRKNRKKVLFIILGIALAFTLFFVFVATVISKSDAHVQAEKYISANAEVQQKSGGIKDFGMLPTGSIQTTNGYGNADLTLSVNGKKHDMKVFVHLEKEPETEWKVLHMEIVE